MLSNLVGVTDVSLMTVVAPAVGAGDEQRPQLDISGVGGCRHRVLLGSLRDGSSHEDQFYKNYRSLGPLHFL